MIWLKSFWMVLIGYDYFIVDGEVFGYYHKAKPYYDSLNDSHVVMLGYNIIIGRTSKVHEKYNRNGTSVQF